MLRQIVTITTLSLGTIRARAGMSLVVLFSIAAVVAVMVSLLAMQAGIDHAIAGTASPARAVLIDANSGQSASNFPTSEIATIGDLPGVAHDAGGAPLISTNAIAGIKVSRKGSGALEDAYIFGVNGESFAMYSKLHLISGRMFHRAVRELIVGGWRLRVTKGWKWATGCIRAGWIG